MLHLIAHYLRLGSPHTLSSALAAVTARVASMLLGVQDASAGAIIRNHPRR